MSDKQIEVKDEPIEIKEEVEESVNDINFQQEDEDIFIKEWWVRHPIPKKQRCTINGCTFEPGEHVKHSEPTRAYSKNEQRILLKYLIQKHEIRSARGLKVFERMRQQQYLTHRTAESLRNCLRRTIIPGIVSFGLPQETVKKLKALKIPK